MATSHGLLNLVRELVEMYGARSLAKNDRNQTPVFFAFFFRQPDVLEYFQSKGSGTEYRIEDITNEVPGFGDCLATVLNNDGDFGGKECYDKSLEEYNKTRIRVTEPLSAYLEEFRSRNQRLEEYRRMRKETEREIELPRRRWRMDSDDCYTYLDKLLSLDLDDRKRLSYYS